MTLNVFITKETFVLLMLFCLVMINSISRHNDVIQTMLTMSSSLSQQTMMH